VFSIHLSYKPAYFTSRRRRGGFLKPRGTPAPLRAWRGRLCDEGDDSNLDAALGAGEREHFVDAREQQRPGISGYPADDASSATASAIG